MSKFKLLWSNLRASFWFVPSLIVAFSIVLAVGLIEADSAGNGEWAERWPRVFGAGAAGARGMLSTIAGSMMTVVGVTFSMVLVTLALASSQYTSRILRNFMRNRTTQIVLGTFSGIFTYCLIVLRTIRGGDEGEFVPSLAVTFGVVLAIVGIGVLILFLHHIASSIQASSIIASVTDETLAAVDRLFPERMGIESIANEQNKTLPSFRELKWQTVVARKTGYIQNVDNDDLLRLAREHKTIVRMERGVGEFVFSELALVSIAQSDAPQPKLAAALQDTFHINRCRTVEQDVGFGIRQLVDIALRALSPGVNDTTTAAMCLDHLTVILARVASRGIPSVHLYEDGELRAIAIGPTFASLVADSFDQIRESAKGNAAIMLRMIESLQTIATQTVIPGRQQVLREQVQWIVELADRTIASSNDLEQIKRRLKEGKP